jgi:hypothetical protein
MARRGSGSNAKRQAEEAAKKLLGLQHFLYLAEAIFENAINAVGNVGQAFIITELGEKALGPMALILPGSKRQPGKGFFRSLFMTAIGPDKYNAIEKIIEEMVEQLVDAWDDSTLQDDRSNVKIFLDTNPEDYLTNTPSPNAQMWAARARMVSGLL